jgi:uncharacterized protein YkwD
MDRRLILARKIVMLTALLVATPASLLLLSTPSLALSLNSFRAEHRLPPLAYSAGLAGAAYAHAHDLAARNRLDHDGFRARLSFSGATGAENVLYGCADEDCAIKMWARSAGHRRNMLMGGVSAYGLASADAENGRRYWVLELGN